MSLSYHVFSYLLQLRYDLQVVRRVHGQVHGLVHRVPVAGGHRDLHRHHAHPAPAAHRHAAARCGEHILE